MKIKDYKCKCGSDDFFFTDKGNQKGIYCCKCGKWLKWADKNERNLEQQQDDKRMQENEWDTVYKKETHENARKHTETHDKRTDEYWINLLNLFPDDSEHICECQNARTEILGALLDKPCKDAISKQDAIRALKHAWAKGLEPTQFLEVLPPVSPARPTGKWIDHSDEGYIECPFCHSATNCEDNIEELHYCFSCGASNGGEQE